jgi:hypothetical protein
VRRWTNGLPGATATLGAIMTPLRGLPASQCWMRADTHPGPEHQCSIPEVRYIDAALTFARSVFRLATHGRAIHYGTNHPGDASLRNFYNLGFRLIVLLHNTLFCFVTRATPPPSILVMAKELVPTIRTDACSANVL